MISSAPTPHQQRKLSRTSNSVNNSPNVSSPFHNTPRQVPAPAPAPVQTAASMPPPTPVTAKSQTTKADAHILKNYTPFKKIVETHGPFNIKELSQLSTEIEVTKPVYLFAPELGIINLQALTMSVKSNSGIQSSEVVNALNTLLVATSDVNYAFQIKDIMELLDALSSLGKDVLNKIVGVNTEEDCVNADVTKLSANGRIDDIFNRYVKGQGEDILYVVNSLTGEVVSDDEDIEELFSVCDDGIWNLLLTS